MSKATVWLDFKSMADNTFKDKSGKGHDFTGVNTTFEAPGAGLNGTTAYLVNTSATDIYNNAEQSIVMCFKPDFDCLDGANHYFTDSSAASQYLVSKDSVNQIQAYLGNTSVIVANSTLYKNYWKTNGINVLVIAGKSADTDVYLNGVKIVSADNTAWTAKDPAEIVIGTYNGKNSLFFDGTFYHFSCYGQKLSQIQVGHITEFLLGGEYH